MKPEKGIGGPLVVASQSVSRVLIRSCKHISQLTAMAMMEIALKWSSVSTLLPLVQDYLLANLPKAQRFCWTLHKTYSLCSNWCFNKSILIQSYAIKQLCGHPSDLINNLFFVDWIDPRTKMWKWEMWFRGQWCISYPNNKTRASENVPLTLGAKHNTIQGSDH